MWLAMWRANGEEQQNKSNTNYVYIEQATKRWYPVNIEPGLKYVTGRWELDLLEVLYFYVYIFPLDLVQPWNL